MKINFSNRINLICGQNAIGKTNLLEAIYLLSTGRSFRTLHLQDLIKHNENFFFIEAEVENKNISQFIKIYYDTKNKKISLNKSEHQSFSSLLGLLISSLYSSNDFNIIKGKPQIRRNFLNLHLAQEDPLYKYHYFRFMKTLKQRNFLLKSNKLNLLKAYDTELCKSGSYLAFKRKELIKKLQTPTVNFMKKLTKKETDIKINYLSSIEIKDDLNKTFEAYLDELKNNLKKDLIFKTTLTGPHRDDFNILINDISAKNFASEGQKKLILYSLRFAQLQILSNLLGNKAIFLADDFDSHLDIDHKNTLQKIFNEFFQVFITSPNINEKYDDAYVIYLNKPPLLPCVKK